MILDIDEAIVKIHDLKKSKTTIIPMDMHQNVLIMQRDSSDSNPDLWEFPGGGIDIKIETIQDLINEAQRELFEESHLVSSDIDFIALNIFTNPKGDLQGNFFFKAIISNLSEYNLSQEHQNAQIIPLKDVLPILSFENHKEIVQYLLER